MTPQTPHTEINLCDATIRMPKQIAVAWSGGADSTALLRLLVEKGYQVQAWHVDHGWHDKSRQNADVLAEQAKAWHIDFHVSTLKKPLNNLEAEARKGRYACFEKMSKKTGCHDVCLAHHADDQAETVYMRMLQGAGVAGCRGMRPQRQHGQLNIWRPLLEVSRAEIESVLHDRNMHWMQDPSNQDISLWRNKIRCKVFPKIKEAGVNPQVLFLRWQKMATVVQQKIGHAAQNIAVRVDVNHNPRRSVIDWLSWNAQSAPVRAFLLQRMIGLLFADGTVLGRRHILAIEQWREHGGNGWLNLSKCCLYRKGQDLQLCQGTLSLRESGSERMNIEVENE